MPGDIVVEVGEPQPDASVVDPPQPDNERGLDADATVAGLDRDGGLEMPEIGPGKPSSDKDKADDRLKEEIAKAKGVTRSLLPLNQSTPQSMLTLDTKPSWTRIWPTISKSRTSLATRTTLLRSSSRLGNAFGKSRAEVTITAAANGAAAAAAKPSKGKVRLPWDQLSILSSPNGIY
jgi:hypothetical protein